MPDQLGGERRWLMPLPGQRVIYVVDPRERTITFRLNTEDGEVSCGAPKNYIPPKGFKVK